MEFVGDNALPGMALAGAAGLAVGGAVGYIAGRRNSPKKHRRGKKSKNSSRPQRNNKNRSRRKKLKFGSPAWRKRYLSHHSRNQKSPYTAGKRKDTSHRRIRYTKNNQPYIIKSDGRAQFISKKTVRSSKKRKGGKY